MITINNIYNIGDTVFYIEQGQNKENSKIKSGKITSIIYAKTKIRYIIDNFDYTRYDRYDEEKLGTTPEQALENYIEYYKTEEIAKVNIEYNSLKEEIFNNWCKEEEVKLIKTL